MKREKEKTCHIVGAADFAADRFRPVEGDLVVACDAGAALLEKIGFKPDLIVGDFDSLADEWKRLFPSLPIRPGRYEDGMIFLYAPNAPSLFAMRPRLPSIKKALAAQPGAPRKIELRLEIHK